MPALPRRSDVPTEGMVVVRLGTRTLDDAELRRAVDECQALWGVSGLSVLEVPRGDFASLAALRPIVATRRSLFVADCEQLLAAGFAMIPTFDQPHWTLVLDDVSLQGFARLRSVFHGPMSNPAYRQIDQG